MVLLEVDLVLFMAVTATATLEENHSRDDEANDNQSNREERAGYSALIVEEAATA